MTTKGWSLSDPAEQQSVATAWPCAPKDYCRADFEGWVCTRAKGHAPESPLHVAHIGTAAVAMWFDLDDQDA